MDDTDLSHDDEYSTSFEECLNQLETLHWKYDLPADVSNRLNDILDQADKGNRERTAERCGKLIAYLSERHPDYEDTDKLRRYLNGVMTSLYGND